ncbi:AAA family ATPase [soil metagenome]
MELVERDDVLEELRREATRSSRGDGRLIFLAGAAGVGKTSVVRALVEQTRTTMPVMWGACDALSTPRALGPLHDMAVESPVISNLLASVANRHQLLSAILSELSARPRLMIVEDVHWADEATLDLLRFLGRRIDRTPTLMVATFRADEVGSGHPLRHVLGDLASAPGYRRLDVEPLSAAAVRHLASGHPIDAAHLHTITGGNPFFVTEVLAAPGWTVPPTVADAVLARASRLPTDVRAVLEAVSVEPGSTERWLLDGVGIPAAGVDKAVEAGMLRPVEESVEYRHELARLAMESTLEGDHRRELHHRILGVLEGRLPHHPARLAHHATMAREGTAVLKWATAAAQLAAAKGAHREAASHLHDAVAAHDRLPSGEGLSNEDLVQALDMLASELSAVDRRRDARGVRERLVDLRAAMGDEVDLVKAEVDLAHSRWSAGDGDAARALMAEAVRKAEDCRSETAAAHAYTGMGYLAMLSRAGQEAMDACTRAIALAEGMTADHVLVQALNARGSTRIVLHEDLGGIEDLERSARVANEHGWDRDHGAALLNLGSGLGEIRRYDQAVEYLRRAIDFAEERDLDSARHYSMAWLARVHFERGEWDEATSVAERVPTKVEVSPISPIVGLTVLERVRTRRGDANDPSVLAQVWDLAVGTNDVQRLWPVAVARAETVWLGNGDPAEVADAILSTLDRAERLGVRWAVGELGFWGHRLAILDRPLPDAAKPYRLVLEGEHRAAAAAWRALGCPYEEAWALSDIGDEPSMRMALDRLIDLGARPLADRVRHRLRDLEATGIRSGPRPATTRHPDGLTPRQAEVLDLLGDGLTDRQIADRLFISPKTVGHHVAAILRKLEVPNRHQAAARSKVASRRSSG